MVKLRLHCHRCGRTWKEHGWAPEHMEERKRRCPWPPKQNTRSQCDGSMSITEVGPGVWRPKEA